LWGEPLLPFPPTLEVALVGIPACIGALGFTGADIAAGSIAAKVITAAAIADGGGLAVLQAIGAAGMSRDTKIELTSALRKVGVASGFRLSKRGKAKIKDQNPSDKPKKKELW
uniref:Uncharacterized protein n=1 Tax=Catharus ustulatus TaxID=91951 RepID=A0A8C3Y2R3_CATUS